MHIAFICLGGVLDDLTLGVLDYLFGLLINNLSLFDLLEVIVVNNRITYSRLRGLCLLDYNDISLFSVSGVMLRCVD